MSLIDEKRNRVDRRQRDDGPPRGFGERRQAADRRQTDIAEISYIEWATHFAKYQGVADSESEALKAAHAAEVLSRAGR